MKKQLDIKKLVLLNLPYLLMGLFATNFGEGWRMATGADASAKMLSFFSTLPVALASWWPSLHPLDLLVGLCCGAGLRLAVYIKSKNAKKYRHGMEYGSARWGTHEDIAPYIDPVPQNNVILTKTESLTMNSRPKDPKTARNKNVLVIGGSGSGKTRFWLKPNLMQMHSSYVVTDPKGTILVECGKMLLQGAPKLDTGDVIDFTARLYNLSPREAAEKLAQDFGLAYDSQAPPRRCYVRQKTEAQKFKEDRDHAFRLLSDYFHLLRKWEIDYTPKTPEENPHPRFMEAIQKKDYVGYLLDFFLEDGPEEQKLWIAQHLSEIAKLERRVKFMADKPTNRERLQEITAGIEQGIKELFESEKYMRYLSVMSKFYRYSVNNTMLIYMQRPDATLVAGFQKWKNQFERHVKKGEHGITIIAPTPYKKKIEEMKRDPDTHAPILDADGKAVMEEKEIEIPMFRPVKVFDVSQTDGKPLPELASSLSGTVPHYEAFMEALRRSAPVPIEFEAMAENTMSASPFALGRSLQRKPTDSV